MQNKVLACLATHFNVKKNVVQSVVKLDRPITQYGKVTCLEGGDFMIACDLAQETEDSWNTSFIQVEICLFFVYAVSYHSFLQYIQLVDRYAHQKRRKPEFELKNFFSQLKCILVLELPSSAKLNLAAPTMIILALIQGIKATLTNGIYYYKIPGIDEIVDLTTVQCVVGRIQDKGGWAIIDQSDEMAIQVDQYRSQV